MDPWFDFRICSNSYCLIVQKRVWVPLNNQISLLAYRYNGSVSDHSQLSQYEDCSPLH